MTTNRPPSCDLPPEFYKEELKPCPDCGGEAVHGYIGNNSVIACSDLSCQIMGPNNDTHGHKWNSIPRRSEVLELLRLVDEVTVFGRALIDTRNFPDAGSFMIKDLEQLKVYADKLRKDIGE